MKGKKIYKPETKTEIGDSRTDAEIDTWRPGVQVLTHRQGSLMSLMKRGESWVLRTSGEVLQLTAMKHSAHAFRIPHMLSEQSSKNVGIYQTSKSYSNMSTCRWSGPVPIAYKGRATGHNKTIKR